MAFKRPILLPGKVEFGEEQEAGASFSVSFGVRDPHSRRAHLDGRASSG
ncbi:MAG: hypothetical protein JO046_24885 [Solirubrobacterales bacterium]|nr:hypothetical protein [Solirubrobacterales bacterium]